MVVTGRVQDLILSPTETGKISQVIAEGEYYGMQTFDQSLLGHVEAGHVSEEVAMDYASSPHDFKLMLASSGRRASDISQLDGRRAAGRRCRAPHSGLPGDAEPITMLLDYGREPTSVPEVLLSSDGVTTGGRSQLTPTAPSALVPRSSRASGRCW